MMAGFFIGEDDMNECYMCHKPLTKESGKKAYQVFESQIRNYLGV